MVKPIGESAKITEALFEGLRKRWVRQHSIFEIQQHLINAFRVDPHTVEKALVFGTTKPERRVEKSIGTLIGITPGIVIFHAIDTMETASGLLRRLPPSTDQLFANKPFTASHAAIDLYFWTRDEKRYPDCGARVSWNSVGGHAENYGSLGIDHIWWDAVLEPWLHKWLPSQSTEVSN